MIYKLGYIKDCLFINGTIRDVEKCKSLNKRIQLTTYVIDKSLVSRTYKEYLQISKKRQPNGKMGKMRN